MNLIQPGSFLTLHYRLAGPDGADVVNTFNDKPATLSLGTGQLAPAMERHLLGLPTLICPGQPRHSAQIYRPWVTRPNRRVDSSKMPA